MTPKTFDSRGNSLGGRHVGGCKQLRACGDHTHNPFGGMSRFSSSRKGKKDEDLLVVGQKPPKVWAGGGYLDKNVKIQYKWNKNEMFVGTVKAKLGKKAQVRNPELKKKKEVLLLHWERIYVFIFACLRVVAMHTHLCRCVYVGRKLLGPLVIRQRESVCD